MRWFFLLLLAINVGYVALELSLEPAEDRGRPELPRGVERIVLLRELESEQADDEGPAKQSVQAGVRPAEASPSGEATTPGRQAEAETVSAASDQPEHNGAVDDNAAIREYGSLSEQQIATAAPAPEPEPEGDLCYTLGPFREMKTLRLVTREIKDYVVEASFRSKEEQEQTMFRVFVRPVGSKQEAKAVIKELVSKNIRDYFIITDGPNKNGISLGYFSNKNRAYRHADRVRKLGFDATAEPVFRSYTIYWLDYKIKAGNEIPQQIFDQHLESSAQRLGRDCH